MFASWSRLLVVLLASILAFTAPGRETRLGPHQRKSPYSRSTGTVINEGDFVMGKAEHFDPPGNDGDHPVGYALDSGQGNDQIRVALLEVGDPPAGLVTNPHGKYTMQPNDGYISMGPPPVAKAKNLKKPLAVAPSVPNFNEMKRDIGKNCGAGMLLRRDGLGSCQIAPKNLKTPAPTVKPAGPKKK